MKRILISAVLCLFGTMILRAQNSEYEARIDTTYMLIGDQQHFTMRVKTDAGARVLFPRLKDTIVSGVEVISGPVRDSAKQKDGRWLFEEKYVITSFDTGVYVIPEMAITVERENYNNVLRTEPLSFVVNTLAIDKQDKYDIVMPYDAPWSFAEILPILLYVLGGLILIAVIIALIIRYRSRQPLFVSRKEEVPPYVLAIRALDEIKDKKLWQTGKEKEYYTHLTDTVREYIDAELQIPAMEQTSGETLEALTDCRKVASADYSRLTELLQTADFVKFAKYTPLQDENARYLDVAYDFVNHTHQKVQQELAEQKEQERREAARHEAEENGKPGEGEKMESSVVVKTQTTGETKIIGEKGKETGKKTDD